MNGLKKVLIFAMIIAVLIVAYDFYRFGVTYEPLRVQVVLEGNNRISLERVLEKLEPKIGSEGEFNSLISISSRSVQKTLQREFPRFETIYVKKDFPNQLVIQVDERHPQALMGRYDPGDETRYYKPVDREGVLFPIEPGEEDWLRKMVPVVLGLEEYGERSSEYKENWQLALRVIDTFEEYFLLEMLSRVHIFPGENVVIYLDQPSRLEVQLGADNFDRKISKLKEMTESSQFREIEEYINLRNLNRILAR